MHKSCFLAGLFLPACAVLGANLNYSLTSGSDVITFTVPQQPSPLPCVFSPNCFSVAPLALVVDGASVSDGTVSFYTPANAGGITILQGTTLLVNNDGPGSLQLFSGTISAPVLTPFSNLQLLQENFGSPFYNEAFLLNASPASTSTPEPGGFSIVCLGALLGLGARRRIAAFIAPGGARNRRATDGE